MPKTSAYHARQCIEPYLRCGDASALVTARSGVFVGAELESSGTFGITNMEDAAC
ncbi:MAG: hypothetical protein ACYSUI_23520 [Planctomycetota bacterium]